MSHTHTPHGGRSGGATINWCSLRPKCSLKFPPNIPATAVVQSKCQTMPAVAFASAPAIFASASARPCRSAAPGILSSDSGRPRRGARGAVQCEVASSSAPSAAGPQAARWAQRTVVIPPQRRGCHLITNKVPFHPRLAPPPRPLSLLVVLVHSFSCVSDVMTVLFIVCRRS